MTIKYNRVTKYFSTVAFHFFFVYATQYIFYQQAFSSNKILQNFILKYVFKKFNNQFCPKQYLILSCAETYYFVKKTSLKIIKINYEVQFSFVVRSKLIKILYIQSKFNCKHSIQLQMFVTFNIRLSLKDSVNNKNK